MLAEMEGSCAPPPHRCRKTNSNDAFSIRFGNGLGEVSILDFCMCGGLTGAKPTGEGGRGEGGQKGCLRETRAKGWLRWQDHAPHHTNIKKLTQTINFRYVLAMAWAKYRLLPFAFGVEQILDAKGSLRWKVTESCQRTMQTDKKKKAV